MPEDLDQSLKERLIAANLKLDENVRPRVEAYIRDHELEGATMINRYVIERNPTSYLVQTDTGIQEVTFDSKRASFSIKSSDMEPWLEEDGITKTLRRFTDRPVGVSISGARVGNISIKGVEVSGRGGKAVEIKDLTVSDVKDFTFNVHGDRVRAQVSKDKISFEISV